MRASLACAVPVLLLSLSGCATAALAPRPPEPPPTPGALPAPAREAFAEGLAAMAQHDMNMGGGTANLRAGWFHMRQAIDMDWRINNAFTSLDTTRNSVPLNAFEGPNGTGVLLTANGVSGFNTQWGGCCGGRSYDTTYTNDAAYLNAGAIFDALDIDASIRFDRLRATGISYAPTNDADGNGIIDFSANEVTAFFVGFSGDTAALAGRDGLIIVSIRIPRLIVGAMIGAALAVSGALMQGLTPNPLADPGLLGVSDVPLGMAFAVMIGFTLALMCDVRFAAASASRHRKTSPTSAGASPRARRASACPRRAWACSPRAVARNA